ncbi:hypothetical protein [Treponema primitia]|uniref:hypothetical protein n=1 Tax=Treponema primitia TaxID=88058 RepID=UPI000255548F|nr:hypothetical protein [Treponema primitia]
MSIISYLETLPLNEIVKYAGGGAPKNGVPFMGYPRQHPSEANKFILMYDPLGDNPRIIEFKTEDILYMENVQAAVTEAGEAAPLAKIWIRKGAHGVILEPFEVDDPLHFANKTKDLREHFLRGNKR